MRRGCGGATWTTGRLVARRRWTRLAGGLGLALLVAAIGLTRLWRLDGPSLWEDDYLNLSRAEMPLADMFAVQKYQGPADTIFDFQPPLIYALEHLALAVDESSLAARLPSLLAGMLLPLVLGLLGRRLFGRGAGLAACLLGVFLLFPISYAQSIKFYAVFLSLAVTSMWLLVRAVDENGPWSWCGYALAATGMVYAGYQGWPTLAVQAVYAGWVLAGRWRVWPPDQRLRRLVPGLVAFGGVAIAVAPWLPAVFFVQRFLHDPGVDPLAGLTPGFAANIVAAFISHDAVVAPGWIAAWVAVALLGAVAAWRDGRRAGLGLLVGWAVVMVLALVGSRTLLRALLGPRHFVLLFPVLVLLAGRGLVAVGQGAARLLAGRRGATSVGVFVAGLGCLVLLWPSLSAYPAYYGRTMSLDREFFQWLDAWGGNVDALEFHGYKRNTRRFAANWYLPGRFGEAGTFAGPGYRRLADIDTCYTDAAAGRPWQPGLPVKEFGALFTTTRVTLVPAAGRAPLVMDPGPDGAYRYATDFRTRHFYEDAFAAANMALDTELGLLRPARYSRPAEATWAFEVAPGQVARDIRLTVAAALYKGDPELPADAVLTVAASPDGAHWTPLGVIGQEAFPVADGRPVTEPRPFFEEIDFYHGRCRETRRDYAVPGELAAGGRLYVRVGYRPGHVEGFLNLAGLTLAATVRPVGAAAAPAAAPGDAPLVRQAAHLLENVRAVAWDEASDGRDVGLYAFAAPGFSGFVAAGLPVGSPGDEARFRDRHPALAPASVLSDRDGRPALRLYDVCLTRPGLALNAATPAHRWRGLPPTPSGPVALRLQGTIAIPHLRLGGQAVTVPVLAPAGSTLTLNPGGRGRLLFVPDWTDKARFAAPMAHMAGVVPSKRLRGELVCRDGETCSFRYAFVSALPITRAHLKVFPQVYANPCRKCPANEARVEVSTDNGRTWRTLVADTGGEDCTWTKPGAYAVRSLTFDPPATSLLLAFRLGQGGQAGFLSPSWNVDGMYLSLDLDARSLPPLTLPAATAAVSLDDPGQNDFSLFVRPAPWPISDRTVEP